MNLDLEGKTALVTGAAGDSIGNAIARGLAAEGVHLCIAARRKDALDQAAEEIVAAGGRQPFVVSVDLTESDGPPRLAQQAIDKLGHVDILVNSAGYSVSGWTVESPEEKWQAEMDLIFNNIRKTALAVVPGMIKQGWGRIINVTGHSEVRDFTGSTASKAAVHGFSKGLSNEVSKHGVTVNCLAPGKIATGTLRSKYSEAKWKKTAEEVPMQRWGETREFADVAVFLASPRASYVTGTVIPIDGGYRRYVF
jgi:3-oxoacyl-[acyl-carrier protein] reductase